MIALVTTQKPISVAHPECFFSKKKNVSKDSERARGIIVLIVILFFATTNTLYCLENKLTTLAANLNQLAIALKKPKTSAAPIPLKNLGASCYMNSVVQVLLAIEPITSLLVQEANPYPPDSLAYAFVDFVQAVHNLPSQEDATYTTALNALTNKQLKTLVEKARAQMGGCGPKDADTFRMHLLNALRQQEKQNPLSKIITSRIKDSIICPSIGIEINPNPELTSTIITSAKFPTLYASLDNYVTPRPLAEVDYIEGYPPQYDCFSKTTILELSDIVFIALNHGMEAADLAKPVDIPLVLDFEKYGIPNSSYHLIAAVQNTGRHGVAYVNKNGQWYFCDDAKIKPVAFSEIKNSIGLANLVVYQKTKKEE